MTYPNSTANIITVIDYNGIQSRASEILGLTTSGWGATAIYTQPVTDNTRITAFQWNSLISDLNIISEHVDNITTTTSYLNTGVGIISSSTGIELNGFNNYYWDGDIRYNCHPLQYVLDESTSTPTPKLFISSSTRTTSWGISPITINHGVTASFPTRLQAYYYFNLGNYLVWKPSWIPEVTVYNDLDQEWINWTNWINARPEEEFRFGRDQFLAGSYTKTYTSGTLSISVVATADPIDNKNISFNVTYANEATSLFVIIPGAAGYTINI